MIHGRKSPSDNIIACYYTRPAPTGRCSRSTNPRRDVLEMNAVMANVSADHRCSFSVLVLDLVADLPRLGKL